MNKRMLEKIDAANDLIKSLGIPNVGFTYYSRRRVWFHYENKRGVISLASFTALRNQLEDLLEDLQYKLKYVCVHSNEKRDFTDIEPLKETADLSAEETT